MRARLHDLMPDFEEEVEYECDIIRNSATAKVLAAWLQSMEETLSKKAAQGETKFCTKQLPKLEDVLVGVKAILDMHNNRVATADALATELAAFCYGFVTHWRSHSDVDLHCQLEAFELMNSNGKKGFMLTFDWTPTAAESQQKKHKK